MRGERVGAKTLARAAGVGLKGPRPALPPVFSRLTGESVIP